MVSDGPGMGMEVVGVGMGVGMMMVGGAAVEDTPSLVGDGGATGGGASEGRTEGGSVEVGTASMSMVGALGVSKGKWARSWW